MRPRPGRPKYGRHPRFCNAYAAYEARGAEDKAALENPRAAHPARATPYFYEPEP